MKVVAARARVDLHRTKDIVLGDDSGGTGILLILAPVAQLDRASDYGVSGTERNADQGKRCSAASEKPRIRRC